MVDMANTGAQLGQVYQTYMPAMTDNADIQAAFRMLWYGDPNADLPSESKGVEAYLDDFSTMIESLAARRNTDIIYAPAPPERNTAEYSDWIWVDTSVTNADGASRPMYFWDGTQWSQIAGAADPAASYTWTGIQVFNEALTLLKAINGFANADARAAGITNPTKGTISYLESSNRYEYYDGSAWVPIGSIEKIVKTKVDAVVNMIEDDADAVLLFTHANPAQYVITANQIKVGSSIYISRQASTPLTITAEAGVTLKARQPVLGQYASIALTKTGLNEWIVQGSGAALPPGGNALEAPLKASSQDYDLQWIKVVPAAGGIFTGAVTMSQANIINANIDNLSVQNRRVFIQHEQPVGMSAGDIWIQN